MPRKRTFGRIAALAKLGSLRIQDNHWRHFPILQKLCCLQKNNTKWYVAAGEIWGDTEDFDDRLYNDSIASQTQILTIKNSPNFYRTYPSFLRILISNVPVSFAEVNYTDIVPNDDVSRVELYSESATPILYEAFLFFNQINSNDETKVPFQGARKIQQLSPITGTYSFYLLPSSIIHNTLSNNLYFYPIDQSMDNTLQVPFDAYVKLQDTQITIILKPNSEFTE